MISYDELLERMERKYRDTAGFTPDRYSDTGIRLRILAGELYNLTAEAEWLKKEMFPSTADGTYLEKHAAERGLTRKAAVKARGYVSFAKEYATDTTIIISRGTVVTTGGEHPLRYSTVENLTIPAGVTYGVAEVEAERGGSAYNVGTGEICSSTVTIPDIVLVVNNDPITGGADAESDEMLRKRLLDTYKNRNNGTNISYYRELAQSVEEVYSAGVIPSNRGTGTVDIFINKIGGASADNDLVQKVQAIMSEQREINVDVLVQTALPSSMTVYFLLAVKSGYDFNTVKNQCIDATMAYINSLGVGSTFYLSELGSVLHKIEGVRNFNFDPDYCTDLGFSQSRFPVCGQVTVEEIV